MKRAATIDQKRKKRLFDESNPLLRSNRNKQKQRAFDAATEYFKKYKDPLNATLYSVFGPQFFARAAIWLDPLSEFRNAKGIISYPNRYREKPGFDMNGTVKSVIHHTRSQNFIEGDPTIIPEYITSEGDEEVNITNDGNGDYLSWMRDTTNFSRKGQLVYEGDEPRLLEDAPFGQLEMMKLSSNTTGSPNVIFQRQTEKRFFFADGVILPQFEASVDQFVTDIDGPCTSVNGFLLHPELEDFSNTFMNDNVSGMIVNALASKRVYNSFYNIVELKDLPALVKSIHNFQEFLRSSIDKFSKLAELDKELSSLYLAWQFGVKSTIDAGRGLMKTPEKVAKKINYLIDRHNKVTTSRFTRRWLNADVDVDIPTFEFHLPPWVEVLSQNVSKRFDIELRCAINQTVQFPRVAVPSITDRDYRKLIGLEPRIEDIYNLIPFTWLVDWFGGVGQYISIMENIHSDRQLINYGFLTIVITETTLHQAELKVQDSSQVYYIDNDDVRHDIENIVVDRVFPYRREYTRKYQRRVDIGVLEGVRSFGNGLINLSDFQNSILGSLFSQRVK